MLDFVSLDKTSVSIWKQLVDGVLLLLKGRFGGFLWHFIKSYFLQTNKTNGRSTRDFDKLP